MPMPTAASVAVPNTAPVVEKPAVIRDPSIGSPMTAVCTAIRSTLRTPFEATMPWVVVHLGGLGVPIRTMMTTIVRLSRLRATDGDHDGRDYCSGFQHGNLLGFPETRLHLYRGSMNSC